ncbi:glycosyltransferase [Altibacter sp.]|uniref:glycosyltransferase n=1 Tax=Altibacter sp. TaxID=2024823 RepID=UPI000C8F419B|nr:glycosyltransferase [Altibacter sp.]MAP54365.1 glycosyl transferase family 2 [Altibacter sp.]
MNRQYSFIIPVYNRPEETKELLESFSKMVTNIPFEVVIVEDGSTVPSEKIVQEYSETLPISYYFKENSGPGDSRNYGMNKAKGNYFIILDSDCLIPPHYLTTVDAFLSTYDVDCFGGADAAHPSFSDLQKAINYVMTSFLTTGGIRGSERSVQQFEPRSFNMGISKRAFEQTGGFGKIHPGEDPDLSQRIRKQGFKTAFVPNAYVYHKRRISWKKFYLQVKKFGLVRPILTTWHPNAAKVTFWLPSLFIAFAIASLVASIFLDWKFIIPLSGYVLLLFFDATFKNKSLHIGMLAVVALFVQFFGYGISFLRSTFYIRLLKRDPQKQFPNLFFK